MLRCRAPPTVEHANAITDPPRFHVACVSGVSSSRRSLCARPRCPESVNPSMLSSLLDPQNSVPDPVPTPARDPQEPAIFLCRDVSALGGPVASSSRQTDLRAGLLNRVGVQFPEPSARRHVAPLL